MGRYASGLGDDKANLMECVECGCKVARGGVRVKVCGRADCCCANLPTADRAEAAAENT
jgi:hypothetical protein